VTYIMSIGHLVFKECFADRLSGVTEKIDVEIGD
jgi:hypothetical protein